MAWIPSQRLVREARGSTGSPTPLSLLSSLVNKRFLKKVSVFSFSFLSPSLSLEIKRKHIFRKESCKFHNTTHCFAHDGARESSFPQGYRRRATRYKPTHRGRYSVICEWKLQLYFLGGAKFDTVSNFEEVCWKKQKSKWRSAGAKPRNTAVAAAAADTMAFSSQRRRSVSEFVKKRPSYPGLEDTYR